MYFYFEYFNIPLNNYWPKYAQQECFDIETDVILVFSANQAEIDFLFLKDKNKIEHNTWTHLK